MGGAGSKGQTLTPEERNMVMSSWKVIMEKPEDNGVYIFKTFLAKHNYYSFFKKFEGIPPDDLPNNKVFRNHALRIIKGIGVVVDHLDDEEYLKKELIALGKSHKPRNVTEKQFEELKEVILSTLAEVFKLPGDSVNAWNKFLTVSSIYVFKALRGEA